MLAYSHIPNKSRVSEAVASDWSFKMATLVDFVTSSYKEDYKQAVTGLMLENLEFARNKLLPDWAMRRLGIPDSAIPRIRCQAGILDDAIQKLESFSTMSLAVKALNGSRRNIGMR